MPQILCTDCQLSMISTFFFNFDVTSLDFRSSDQPTKRELEMLIILSMTAERLSAYCDLILVGHSFWCFLTGVYKR